MNSRPALCLYHNDADGCASAAIVRRALGPGVKFHAMEYGEPVPWDKIAAARRVILVDFSLSRYGMQRLAQGRELIWIDHHVSAIEQMADISAAWAGARDTRQAACVLTWRFFFPKQPVPQAIVLIGDRDAWHWLEAETGPFDEGLYQQDTDPTHDALWKPLLDDDPQAVSRLVAQGRILRDARLKNIHRQVDNYSFPVVFEGHRTLAVNLRGNGDIGAYARELGYEIAYCYIDHLQNGRLMTSVSLYSAEVDVSEIALRYGGGGHRGAAGFSFERGPSPFPGAASVSVLNKDGDPSLSS